MQYTPLPTLYRVYYKTVYCTTVQCGGCPIKIKDYKQHTDSSFNIVQAIQDEYKDFKLLLTHPVYNEERMNR